MYFRLGDWASGPKHQHHFKAITVRNRFTPVVIVPKETKKEEEEEEEEITEEEEKDEIKPVVHLDEEEEEEEGIVDEEEGHQGIVPTFGEDSFEDDFQIYNETEFVITPGNSTDEVVGNSYQFNHCAV